MVVVLDTRTIPPRQRNEAVMALLGETANALVVTHDLPDELIQNTTRAWQIGANHTLVRVQDTNLRFSRASLKQREEDREYFAISFQHTGTGIFYQEDCVVTQPAGALVLENVTDSVGFAFAGKADNQSFLMSHEDLGLPVSTVLQASTRLGSSPLYRMVQVHLARLSDVAEQLDPDSAASELLATTTVTLVRALIASTADGEAPAIDALHDSLQTTVLTYVQQHLRDPDLSPQMIASANHVSVRQLYKLWSVHGESLSNWILRERLDGARKDLVAPESILLPIEVVARKWGFVDRSHFSRRFRETFGASPREWRMHGQTQQLRRPAALDR